MNNEVPGLQLVPLLSDRERKVLRYLYSGHTAKRMTTFLAVSRVATIHQYISRARQRLRARTATQASVVMALADYRAGRFFTLQKGDRP